MIEISEALSIHRILIEKFGGLHGVRDESLLGSALQRPFQTFDAKPLYNSVLERAGALIESILINHPFVDGNKRTGYVLLRRYLIQNSLDINATEEQKFDLVIAIASGQIKFDDIVSWLKKYTVQTIGAQ